MRNGRCLFSYGFEVWIDVFIIEGVVVVLDLTSNCDPVRPQKLTEIMLASLGYFINEKILPVFAVSNELTD